MTDRLSLSDREMTTSFGILQKGLQELEKFVPMSKIIKMLVGEIPQPFNLCQKGEVANGSPHP